MIDVLAGEGNRLSGYKAQVVLLALGLSLLALTACSTAQAFLPSSTQKIEETITYAVQPGETLSQIAARFHVSIEELIALNSDKYPSIARDPSTIKPGWQLRVPKLSLQATPDTSHTDLDLAAKMVIDGINNARALRGQTLLRSDVALTRIANDRSVDMIKRSYFSHTDPQTGQEPLLRYLQAMNYTYRYAGENIAEIKNDAGWVPPWLAVAARYGAAELSSEFVTGWLNSPEHRANIFNSNYRRTGVALGVSPDGRRIVATQVFSD